MRLNKIIAIEGQIELLTGLHIGGGSDAMHIGGVDNPVIKHPHTQEPYIPGSSVKGKVRSLLEWYYGLVEYTHGSPFGFKQIDKVSADQKDAAFNLVKLFGASGGDISKNDAQKIGPTRITVRDAMPTSAWLEDIKEKSLLLTEAKSENTINRISGTADNPRQSERVPSGASFDFSLQIKVLEGDDEQALVNMVLTGLKLLEQDALGGSGSRGYGRVQFKLKDELAHQFAAIHPFANRA